MTHKLARTHKPKFQQTANLVDWQTNMTPQRSGFEVVRDPEDRKAWRAIIEVRKMLWIGAQLDS
jgi:hypothetical protein